MSSCLSCWCEQAEICQEGNDNFNKKNVMKQKIYKYWGGWATTAQVHIRFYSYQLKKGIWGYSGYRHFREKKVTQYLDFCCDMEMVRSKLALTLWPKMLSPASPTPFMATTSRMLCYRAKTDYIWPWQWAHGTSEEQEIRMFSKLCDATLPRISQECFKEHVEIMPWRIQAGLRARWWY